MTPDDSTDNHIFQIPMLKQQKQPQQQPQQSTSPTGHFLGPEVLTDFSKMKLKLNIPNNSPDVTPLPSPLTTADINSYGSTKLYYPNEFRLSTAAVLSESTNRRVVSEYVPLPTARQVNNNTIKSRNYVPPPVQSLHLHHNNHSNQHQHQKQDTSTLEIHKRRQTRPPDDEQRSVSTGQQLSPKVIHREYHHPLPQETEVLYDAYDSNNEKLLFKAIKPLGVGAFSQVFLARQVSPASAFNSPTETARPEMITVVNATTSLSNPDNSNLEIIQEQMNQDRLYAIKLVDLTNADRRMHGSLSREIQILKSLSHPNLIRLHAYKLDVHAMMVLTYTPGGDLFDFIASYRTQMSLDLLRRIFGDVLRAVAFLHTHNVVHRDIKLENVLLTRPAPEILSLPYDYPEPIAVLTDLGLARKTLEGELLVTRCGSEDYVPPELLMGQKYDGRQTDSWAMGVLLYAMMEGRLPFDPPHGRGKVAHRIARVEWGWREMRKYSANHNSGEGDSMEEDMETVEGYRKGMKIVESCLQKRDVRARAVDLIYNEWVQLDVPFVGQAQDMGWNDLVSE